MKVEKRTFISEVDFPRILEFFEKESSKQEIEKQVLYFYHTENDFRIVRTKKYIKMDLKPDNVYDQEQVVYVADKYDQSLIDMFQGLGIAVDFKRYRIRHKFLYKNYYLTLDENIKFGNVLRVAVEADTTEADIVKSIQDLYQLLNIEESTMDKFNELYSKYRVDWADLTKNINDIDFLNQ